MHTAHLARPPRAVPRVASTLQRARMHARAAFRARVGVEPVLHGFHSLQVTTQATLRAQRVLRHELHTISMCESLHSAFQSFLSVFTQISPCLDTLGWKMGVTKKPLGGAAGKSGPKTSLIRNTPPSYGVSAVHRTAATHMQVLSVFCARSGGGSLIRFAARVASSIWRRLLTIPGPWRSARMSMTFPSFTCRTMSDTGFLVYSFTSLIKRLRTEGETFSLVACPHTGPPVVRRLESAEGTPRARGWPPPPALDEAVPCAPLALMATRASNRTSRCALCVPDAGHLPSVASLFPLDLQSAGAHVPEEEHNLASPSTCDRRVCDKVTNQSRPRDRANASCMWLKWMIRADGLRLLFAFASGVVFATLALPGRQKGGFNHMLTSLGAARSICSG
jgi:hypothetical protein